MNISNDDMMELKRLAANTYEQDKSNQIHRIIRGIGQLESQVRTLKIENEKLKADLEQKNV
jgi:hypothetical protein